MEHVEAMQTTRALSWVDRELHRGRWVKGHRYDRGGRCLIGHVDVATEWMAPGVRPSVQTALAAQLPRPLRVLASVAPRTALKLYNDVIGRRRGVRRLVKSALAAHAAVADPWTPADVVAIPAGSSHGWPHDPAWTARTAVGPDGA